MVWNEHWEPQLKSGKLFLATLAAVSKKTSRTSTDQPPDVCIFERFRIFRECTQVLNWSAPKWPYLIAAGLSGWAGVRGVVRDSSWDVKIKVDAS